MSTERDFALVIGVADYPRFRSLSGPEQDARAFAQWLTSVNGGGIPQDHCKLILTDPDPLYVDQFMIDDALRELRQQAAKISPSARRLYFYFAGHGVSQEVSRDDNSLCLSYWSNDMPHLAISLRSYLDKFVQCGEFEQLIFFLDCCRTQHTSSRGMEPYWECYAPSAQSAKVRTFEAFATSYLNPSFEGADTDGKSQGYFTQALLSGLQGEARDDNGNITAAGLKKFLEKRTPELAGANNKKQEPEINNHLDDTEIFGPPGIPKPSWKVNISFSAMRTGLIRLSDGKFNAVDETTVVPGSTWTVHVESGLYRLEEVSTGQKLCFEVSDHTDAQF